MRNTLLRESGEVELTIAKYNHVAIDEMEEWQVEALLEPVSCEDTSFTKSALILVDKLVDEWIESLSQEQWQKIRRQKSLKGIPLPEKWVKVWRHIVREPRLRDKEGSTKDGKQVGTYPHIWNMSIEELLVKYTDELDKELIDMVDKGFLYNEIGEILHSKYGEKFWKPRKKETKTTPAQVVNYYLYWKIPNKIVRQEMLDLCLFKLNKIKKRKGA